MDEFSVHLNADDNLDPATQEALGEMVKAAYKAIMEGKLGCRKYCVFCGHSLRHSGYYKLPEMVCANPVCSYKLRKEQPKFCGYCGNWVVEPVKGCKCDG